MPPPRPAAADPTDRPFSLLCASPAPRERSDGPAGTRRLPGRSEVDGGGGGDLPRFSWDVSTAAHTAAAPRGRSRAGTLRSRRAGVRVLRGAAARPRAAAAAPAAEAATADRLGQVDLHSLHVGRRSAGSPALSTAVVASHGAGRLCLLAGLTDRGVGRTGGRAWTGASEAARGRCSRPPCARRVGSSADWLSADSRGTAGSGQAPASGTGLRARAHGQRRARGVPLTRAGGGDWCRACTCGARLRVHRLPAGPAGLMPTECDWPRARGAAVRRRAPPGARERRHAALATLRAAGRRAVGRLLDACAHDSGIAFSLDVSENRSHQNTSRGWHHGAQVTPLVRLRLGVGRRPQQQVQEQRARTHVNIARKLGTRPLHIGTHRERRPISAQRAAIELSASLPPTLGCIPLRTHRARDTGRARVARWAARHPAHARRSPPRAACRQVARCCAADQPSRRRRAAQFEHGAHH